MLLNKFNFTVFHVEKPMRGDVHVAVAVLLQRGIVFQSELAIITSPCFSLVFQSSGYCMP